MNIGKGMKIKYEFPNPVSRKEKIIEGVVDFVGQNFVRIKTDKITLKISYKNFDRLKLV